MCTINAIWSFIIWDKDYSSFVPCFTTNTLPYLHRILYWFVWMGADPLGGKTNALFSWKPLCLNYVLSTRSDMSSIFASCRASSLHESTSVPRGLFRLDTPCGAARDRVQGREQEPRDRRTETDTGQTGLAAVWVRCQSHRCQRAPALRLDGIGKFEKFCM